MKLQDIKKFASKRSKTKNVNGVAVGHPYGVGMYPFYNYVSHHHEEEHSGTGGDGGGDGGGGD